MAMHAVAYYENTYGKALVKDMAKIFKSGARVVIYCVSERNALFNRQGVIDNVKIIHAAGLVCYINFWAAFGIFGGEEFSGYLQSGGRACTKVEAFRQIVADHIDLAAVAGADGIFWDEPEMKCRTDTGGPCCSTLEFIAEVTAHAAARGLKNEVCIPPLPENWKLLAAVFRLKFVDIVSSNTYYDIEGYKFKYRLPHIHVKQWSEYLVELGRRFHKEVRMFLQGFKRVVMDGYEQMPMSAWIKITAAAARAAGIRHFAFWAFDGCESLSSLWPNGQRQQCAKVWRVACEIFSSNPESELSWL